MSTGTRRGSRHRAGGPAGERGSILVEAAIIFPVLIMITFGIIEYGMAYSNVSTVGSASRSAARLGATGYTGAADKSAFVTQMGKVAQKDLSAMSSGTPIQMWVYRDATGQPATCTASNRCWLLTWDSSTRTWSAPSGGWTDPDACGATVDTIGVYVQARHRFMTGMFGATKTIGRRTTLRIEPLPSDQCPDGAT